MVDFSYYHEACRWFEAQPSSVAVTIAARSALRVFPLIVTSKRSGPEVRFFNALLLPCLRAAAAAHFAFYGVEPDAIYAAARAADAAARAADAAARAAGAAARAAGANDNAYTAAIRAADGAYAADAAARAADATTAAYLASDDAAPDDAAFIEAVQTPEHRAARAMQMNGRPLWPEGVPPRIDEAWVRLKAMLLARKSEDWPVWIDWCEDRLAGRLADPDLARIRLPNELWEKGATGGQRRNPPGPISH
jgi:hypothetical protein